MNQSTKLFCVTALSACLLALSAAANPSASVRTLSRGQILSAARLSPLGAHSGSFPGNIPPGLLEATQSLESHHPADVTVAVSGPWVALTPAIGADASETEIPAKLFFVETPDRFSEFGVSPDGAARLQALVGHKDPVTIAEFMHQLFDLSRTNDSSADFWNQGWDNPLVVGLTTLDRTISEEMVLSDRTMRTLSSRGIEAIGDFSRDSGVYLSLSSAGRKELRREWVRLNRQAHLFAWLSPENRAQLERAIGDAPELSSRARHALEKTHIRTFAQAATLSTEELRELIDMKSLTHLRDVLRAMHIFDDAAAVTRPESRGR